MKQFLAALALLAVIGFTGFIYRNTVEMRGPANYAAPGTGPTVCTQEAMTCPDGSSVGRTGPGCTFAPCPTVASSSPAVSSSTTTGSAQNI